MYASWVGFPGSSDGKESACSAGKWASVPGLGRSPGEGNGYPLQYSCFENSMDRGAWWAVVQGSKRVRHDWATDTSAMLPTGSIGGKEMWEEQGKIWNSYLSVGSLLVTGKFSRMPVPIEMDDYECIVTSLCLCECILLSAWVVKLEQVVCSRHRVGKGILHGDV